MKGQAAKWNVLDENYQYWSICQGVPMAGGVITESTGKNQSKLVILCIAQAMKDLIEALNNQKIGWSIKTEKTEFWRKIADDVMRRATCCREKAARTDLAQECQLQL